MSQAGFLEAIRAQPDDDAPRLIYADWLEENGDAARAEFIRVQCELARLDDDPDRRDELVLREAVLLRKNKKRWTADLPKIRGIKWGEFRRGFVEDATAGTFKWFETNADRIREAIHLRGLTVHFAAGFKAFERGGCLAGLERFHANGMLGEAGVVALARCPHVGSLTHLDLSGSSANAVAAHALAWSPHLGGLTDLNLDACPGLGSTGCYILAGSHYMTRLKALSLFNGGAGSVGVVGLASAPNLAGLMSLGLNANRAGDEGVRALASSPVLHRLRHLDLAENELSPAAAKALAGFAGLADLRELWLHRNPLGDAGARALFRSPHLTRLTTLGLGSTELTDKTVNYLAEWPQLGRLVRLDLGGNRITDEGVRVLARSPLLARLRRLDLGGERVTDVGAKILAESPNLPRLRYLNLITSRLHPETWHVLRKRFGWDGC